MNSSQFLDMFNTNLQLFLKNLQNVYPTEQMFKKAIVSLDTVTLLDKRRPINEFMKYAEPHKEELLNKDEHFFLNMNLNDMQVSQSSLSVIGKLKEYVLNMSHNNKEMVWKWLITLYHIGNKYKSMHK